MTTEVEERTFLREFDKMLADNQRFIDTLPDARITNTGDNMNGAGPDTDGDTAQAEVLDSGSPGTYIDSPGETFAEETESSTPTTDDTLVAAEQSIKKGGRRRK